MDISGESASLEIQEVTGSRVDWGYSSIGRSLPRVHEGPGLCLQYWLNWTRWWILRIPALGRWMKEDQEFKVIFVYIASSKPATWDLITKQVKVKDTQSTLNKDGRKERYSPMQEGDGLWGKGMWLPCQLYKTLWDLTLSRTIDLGLVDKSSSWLRYKNRFIGTGWKSLAWVS